MTQNIIGLREALRDLNKIDPELAKELIRNAKKLTAPAVAEIKANYPTQPPLSGWERKWQPGGRKFPITPWSKANAVRGIKVSARRGGRYRSVISIAQINAAASVYEMAGRKSANKLGDALTSKHGEASRNMWPAVERHKDDIERGIMNIVKVIEFRTNRKLAR